MIRVGTRDVIGMGLPVSYNALGGCRGSLESGFVRPGATWREISGRFLVSVEADVSRTGLGRSMRFK